MPRRSSRPRGTSRRSSRRRSSKGRQKKASKNPGKAKKKGGGFSISIGKIGLKKMTTFTRQLSTLQDAGLPLLRSVQILESQQRPGKLKSILGDVAEDVESGSSLSDSMAKHPKAFDRLYSKMVAAGEVGGVLDIILQRLADFMEKGERLRRRIKGALIYPAVVISIAVLIVTGIMYFVIPKFQEIFNDFDVELPGLTVWLVNASKWVAGGSSEDQAVPGAVWILLSPFLIFGLYKLIRVTGPGKAATGHRLRADTGDRATDSEDGDRPVHADARHADQCGCADSRSDPHHPGHLGQLHLRTRAVQRARLDSGW